MPEARALLGFSGQASYSSGRRLYKVREPVAIWCKIRILKLAGRASHRWTDAPFRPFCTRLGLWSASLSGMPAASIGPVRLLVKAACFHDPVARTSWMISHVIAGPHSHLNSVVAYSSACTAWYHRVLHGRFGHPHNLNTFGRVPLRLPNYTWKPQVWCLVDAGADKDKAGGSCV